MRLLPHQILAMRAALGKGATMHDVATALKVAPITIRRRLSDDELHAWAQDVRTDRPTPRDRAIRKIKARHKALGRLPTARESCVHTSVMTAAGGYNKLVEAAGFTARLSTKGRMHLPRRIRRRIPPLVRHDG